MKRICAFCCIVVTVVLFSGMSLAAGPLNEEKVFNEHKSIIPAAAIRTVEDLHSTWQAIQAGTSKAVIVDIRREAEFDAGHIKDSNNLEAEMVYTLPKKLTDPNAEIWVFCRTKHRATYFVATLYEYGYKNVYLVDKGIVGWVEKGYPLFNKYLGEIKVAKYLHNSPEQFAFRENK